MRVKISYGINVDEVPEEVSILLVYAYAKESALNKQLELVNDLVDDEDLESAIGILNNTRRTLVELDSRLADIEAIARGYVNHKIEEEQGDRDVSNRGPFVDSTRNSDDGSEPQQSTVRIHK